MKIVIANFRTKEEDEDEQEGEDLVETTQVAPVAIVFFMPTVRQSNFHSSAIPVHLFWFDIAHRTLPPSVSRVPKDL